MLGKAVREPDSRDRGRFAALATLVGVALIALLALPGCGGGAKQGPLPGIAEAKAQRDTADGAAKLTSTITVRFDRTFSFAPRKVPLASLFELSLPMGSGTRRVLVRSAQQSTDNSRIVTLGVDVLVPDGAELKVLRKAFRANETGDITTKVSSDLNNSLIVLASVALTPSNASFLAAPTVAAVKPEDRDPAAMRAVLEQHLRARGSPDEVVSRALDRYDTMPDSVSGPKARAALAALTGTFAEPSIDSLLTANNCTGKPLAKLSFEVPPDNPDLFARVTYTATGARIVSLNPQIEGDRLEDIMPLLAHEPIHCDQVDGRYEEIAATAFDTFLYLNLVAAFPELVDINTKLARDLNVDAVAMVNSGRVFPEFIGILPSPGVRQVLPNTNSPSGSFAELVANAYPGITFNDSPDEPLAQAYVAILAKAAGMPAASAFNLRYLDELLARSFAAEAYGAILQAFGFGTGE
ncbi:MAG: hypothetical protein HYX53_13700 [Chloroflexi bacterium]|nr:hypothetical protein [Chloroflexota bacterium]